MDAPDVIGLAGVPGQGRFMALCLRIEEGRIVQALFECHGCGVTVGCGSALTELITGLSTEDCRRLNCRDLVAALDGVPADRGDCPEFAMHALRDALLKERLAFVAQPLFVDGPEGRRAQGTLYRITHAGTVAAR